VHASDDIDTRSQYQEAETHDNSSYHGPNLPLTLVVITALDERVGVLRRAKLRWRAPSRRSI
jgi:hypothetical protein